MRPIGTAHLLSPERCLINMNRVAKFKIENVFKLTGRGLVFAGRITNGSVSLGNTLRFSINKTTYNRRIIGIEEISHSITEKVSIGLLIQCINTEEIDKLRNFEKDLKIEVDIFDNKKYPKIFAISGLGADKRIFDFLTLDNYLIPLDWITPKENEPIEVYAKRFAENYELGKENDFIILGVSFGGLVATEISKLYKPRMTILISSAETKDEIFKFGKFIGRVGIAKILPKKLFDPPRKVAHYLFGTDKRKLLNSILNDTDLGFTKWAVNELINWNNDTKLDNVVKIGGSRDKLMPPKDKKAIIIKGGGHFMIVDKATEVSKIINEQLKSTTPLHEV